MSRHDDHVSLRQMLDHAREAVDMAKPRSRDDLDRDRLLNLALTRLIEIIGESANRVSNATQSQHAGIPWRMSETPCEVWRAAPTLGQDNDYVYGELLGMSSQQIAELVERKVIY